jgi:hypothetical protein
VESFCIFQLVDRRHTDVAVHLAFTAAPFVPRTIRFEHASTSSAAFEGLGEVHLHERSLEQLRHMFKLGANTEVKRLLRITMNGHLSWENSGGR